MQGSILYTLSIKRNSYHFFRATLTKIHNIKINYIWTQISYCSPYEAHLKKSRIAFVKKEKNAVKSQKVIFQKSQKLLTESLNSYYSYSFNFNGGLCNCRTGFCPCLGVEQFLWFLKNYLLRFHLILLLFYSSKRLFHEMCLVRSTVANLCQIMIHFIALDFSECRSEEVFLLTISVHLSSSIIHVESEHLLTMKENLNHMHDTPF